MTNVQGINTKRVYDLEKRTLAFAKAVINLCKQIAINPVNKEIVGQLVRSSGSIGANYREANDSLSKKDFAHRIKISRKEAKETLYWLELLSESVPSLEDEIAVLLQEATELKLIFASIADKCTLKVDV